jgi:hypothetical protein
LTERYDWDAVRDSRNCRRYAQVGDLAKAACGFVLAVGMYVWGNLQKERERKQRERERHWPGEFAEDGMYSKQHFRASPKDRLPEKAPSPHCGRRTLYNFQASCSDTQAEFLDRCGQRKTGCTPFNRY